MFSVHFFVFSINTDKYNEGKNIGNMDMSHCHSRFVLSALGTYFILGRCENINRQEKNQSVKFFCFLFVFFRHVKLYFI